MDFSALNTKVPAEKGAFLHLKHPALGTLLWDGEGADRKKVGVYVRGIESKTVQDRIKRTQKEKLDGVDGAEEAGRAFAVSLIVSFDGVERDGKPLPATDEGIQWFFDQSDGFVEQVLKFAQDRASFFK